ncbi:hypothetical protein [Demequina sp. NBRC 110051]|uniref:hypothetical protein n=1 Tax=Demequina sp. NBRC 110051 TaxID=1570340 RepID=UPI00117E6E5A|nr:hypothetical protein [Demequina sp. NBRC 110051]
MRGRTRGVLGLLAAAMVPPAAAFAVGLVAIAVTLSACAPGGAAVPPGQVQYEDRLDMGTPGAAERVITGLTYYPACGNEALSVDGQTWYPYTPANAAELPTSDPAPEPGHAEGEADTDAATASAVWNAVAGAGTTDVAPLAITPAVVEPVPGQDEGVLTIYEGGLAHWTSNLGDLDTWLTSTQLNYTWAC